MDDRGVGRTPGSPSAAAVERHPHLGRPRPPGTVRVDMHTHTMWSGDSTTTPDEFAEGLEAAALDVVCITDHGTTAGAVQLAAALPCRVVVGQEVRTQRGEIIGLFLAERIPTGLAPAEVCRRIRDQGGVVYVPHPFDPVRAALAPDVLDRLVGDGLVDAVEARNAKTSLEHLNRQAAGFAARHGLAAGAGSDSHVPDALGAAYVEVPDFHDGPSFLAALEAGGVVGHHFDAPRPWRARIVPSTSSSPSPGTA